jgi:hypothetical protein
MEHPSSEVGAQRAFSVLPIELFLNVLEQLIARVNGRRPIAYEPSNPITKALYSLALVSRDINPVATQYLYSYCCWLSNRTNTGLLCRTLGVGLASPAQVVSHATEPFHDGHIFSRTSRSITSAFICPEYMNGTGRYGNSMPQIQLPQIIALCNTIGPNLKRLVIDLTPFGADWREIETFTSSLGGNNIFSRMLNLEELVASYNILDFFPYAPPNLKRLALPFKKFGESQIGFCFSTALQTLVLLRPIKLRAKDIEVIFSCYGGKSLDVIFVDVNSNHRTPVGTRSWTNEDTVRFWEADVPTSYYGDVNEVTLCEDYIRSHGINGTLWTQDKRRMASWAEIQRRLAGPVHLIMDNPAA